MSSVYWAASLGVELCACGPGPCYMWGLSEGESVAAWHSSLSGKRVGWLLGPLWVWLRVQHLGWIDRKATAAGSKAWCGGTQRL